jgi:hypothetical protein
VTPWPASRAGPEAATARHPLPQLLSPIEGTQHDG